MTKVDFIKQWHENVQNETGMVFTKKNAGIMYSMLIDQFLEEIKKEGKLNISGFGVFTLKKRPARKGRNPKTGEAVDIPARKTISFRPSNLVKQDLN